MKKAFSEYVSVKKEKHEINEISWTGLIIGTVFMLVFGYKALCEIGAKCVVFSALAVFGLLLFLLGGLFPWVLKKPFGLLKRATDAIGKFIFRIILLPVYFVFTVLAVFVRPFIGKKYEFYSGTEFAKNEPEYIPFYEKKYETARFTTIHIINNVLTFFSENGMKILIPLILMIIILGVVFFFISTHSVLSFIYTLF